MKGLGEPVRAGGIVVALIGFGLTRWFVAGSLQPATTLSFFLAGVVPLAVGLALAVYGVAMAVGGFSTAYVNTVAQWCAVGVGGMLLILLVTAIGPLVSGRGIQPMYRSQLLVANVLLGGAVGGVIIGDRAAANRRKRREIRRQANRAILVNRLLKHEVVNAAAIVEGHAELLADLGDGDGTIDTSAARSVSTIRSAADRIVATISEVGEFLKGGDAVTSVDVAGLLADEVGTLRERYPGVDLAVDAPSDGVAVEADPRVGLVFRELLENAAQNTGGRVAVALTETGRSVRVAVADDGPGLPDRQRELLRSGTFPEYDDPSAGFGLGIVRLLVRLYDGRIDLEPGIDGEGQTVAVTFPKTGTTVDPSRAVGVTFPNLSRAILAGLLAGAVMGLVFAATTDFLPVIGALYGVENPVIGWLTHLFHSVVFALLFAAGCSHPAVGSAATGPLRSGLAGIAWGTVLWLVAAGVVMPLWLQAVGVQSMLPNLPVIGFVAHAVWGLTLGVSYVLLGRVAFPDRFPTR